MRTLRHAAFGELTYKEDLDWFETLTSDWVTVALAADNGEPDDPALLDRLARDLPALASGAAEHATVALFTPGMDAWLDEGETEITPEIFRYRLSLRSVVAHADGAEFLFDDGQLFWGHTVHVWMDASGEYSGAHLSG